MAFDPSTLCARTSAGDAELAIPRLGLSLGQRRILSLLQDPTAIDELAQKHRLDPDKLARDLSRLAELRVVVLHGPGIASDPVSVAAQVSTKAAPSMAPVVIGHSSLRLRTLTLAAGAAAIVLAAGIWYGTHTSESTPPTPRFPANAPGPKPIATAPAPTLPVTRPLNDAAPIDSAAVAVAPATATTLPLVADSMVLRGNPVRSATMPAVAGDLPAAAPGPKPAGVATSAEPVTPSRRDAAGTLPVSAPTAGAPVAVVAPAPTTAPPSATLSAPASAPPSATLSATLSSPPSAPNAAPNAAADAPPPLIATAATPPRPAMTTGLRAISREPPDFPKEAMADGFKSGTVSARLHVDARGSVTGVDILHSEPPRVFDRAARRALLRWRFEPNAMGQTADLDVDILFQLD